MTNSDRGTRQIPSLSIRYALPLVLVLLIVIAVAITGYLSYRSGQQSVEALATRLTQEVTIRIEEHITSFVEIPNLFHEINYAAVISGEVDLTNYDELREYFWNEVYISPSVPYLYYGDEQGHFVGIDTSFGGEPVFKIQDDTTGSDRVTYSLNAEGAPQEEIKRSEYDSRTRPWYQAAVSAGGPTWSPIYVFSAFPVLGISPVMPIYDGDGNLQGVLGIDLTLGELSDFLRGLEISPNGEAFIIERTGEMVATSTDEPPFRTEGEEEVRVLATESESPLIRTTSAQLVQRFNGFENIQERQQITFTEDGETYYAQIAPLKDERGLDWLSVVVIPASDFMGPVYENLRQTALLGLVVLVAASVAGYLMASWIIRPVFTVTDVADAIEDEEWNLEPLNAVAGRTDELGQLARVFQRMAHEVYAREQQLKQQVTQLKIQIDQVKKESAVKEIVESDFFSDLQLKAAALRKERTQAKRSETKSHDGGTKN